MGFYGSQGDRWLNEQSPSGRGFLAELCQDWERATALARQAGLRVVNLRFGLVLSRRGGLLAQMLPVFRTGLGGPLGLGRQYMSWIAIDDLLGAVQHLLAEGGLEGPVNIVSPDPVTNREFSRTLGKVLRRPAVLPVPSLLLRALPGGMAQETMLASQRVEPGELRRSGFTYQFPELHEALQHLAEGAPR